MYPRKGLDHTVPICTNRAFISPSKHFHYAIVGSCVLVGVLLFLVVLIAFGRGRCSILCRFRSLLLFFCLLIRLAAYVSSIK